MTIYGSPEHEEMVNQILEVLEPQYLRLAEEIDGITPNEKIIWHLTSLWMNAAKRLDRDKLPVHKEQFKFILYSVGHIVELLSDTEWDQVAKQSMANLLANLTEFTERYQIKEDVSSFIQQGLNLVINRPANFPWDVYFEMEKGEIKLPSFSPPKSSKKS